MSQISKVFLLLNRDFSSHSADNTKQKILQMKANGRTYASQLASDAETIVHIAGNIPFKEPAHVLACLAIDRIIPQGRSVADDMLEHATFGWFEFDDGLKGAIAAYFGPSPAWMQSTRRATSPAPRPRPPPPRPAPTSPSSVLPPIVDRASTDVPKSTGGATQQVTSQTKKLPTGVPIVLAIGAVAIAWYFFWPSVDADWQNAKASNTALSYVAFLEKHPNSKYAAEAQAQLDLSRFEFVMRSNNASALEKYIELYPSGSGTEKVRAELHRVRWEATNRNSADSLRAYLSQFPNSKYSSEASNRLSEIAPTFTRMPFKCAVWHRGYRGEVVSPGRISPSGNVTRLQCRRGDVPLKSTRMNNGVLDTMSFGRIQVVFEGTVSTVGAGEGIQINDNSSIATLTADLFVEAQFAKSFAAVHSK